MSGGEEGAGRLLVALEGGYNTRVTSEAAAACLEVLSSATAIQRCFVAEFKILGVLRLFYP